MAIRCYGNVTYRITTESDNLFACVTALVLTVTVAEAVMQPPLTLAGLITLKHGKVRSVTVIQKRLKIFLISVLIPDSLRPYALMFCVTLYNLFIAKGCTITEVSVHSGDFVCKCVTNITPKHALLTVEHVRAAYGVGVLKVIVKYQLAFVVDTDSGIHIVRQRQPVNTVKG